MRLQKLPFDEVFSDESGGNIKTPTSEYLPAGKYPVIDQGQGYIAGYVNDSSRICGDGKPAIIFGDHTRCVKFVDFPFCMGADGVKVLRPKIDSDLKYLYHALCSIEIRNAGYDRHFKYLKRKEVPVPPLPEQRRIAQILDKAEALRAKRRAALAKLDTLAQSIFLEMFGDPFRNTKRLDSVNLGELGRWQSGGTPPRNSKDYFGGFIPWFSSGELNSLYVFDSTEKITEKALSESSAKRVPKGALMLGMYDTAALKSSFAAVDCSCNQAIAFSLLDSNKCHPLYVYFAILVGKEDYKSLQRGVRQKNLNLSMIQEISIPNPDFGSQQAFARRVEAIEALKAAHRASLGKLDALFASLQHRAFRGEL